MMGPATKLLQQSRWKQIAVACGETGRLLLGMGGAM